MRVSTRRMMRLNWHGFGRRDSSRAERERVACSWKFSRFILLFKYLQVQLRSRGPFRDDVKTRKSSRNYVCKFILVIAAVCEKRRANSTWIPVSAALADCVVRSYVSSSARSKQTHALNHTQQNTHIAWKGSNEKHTSYLFQMSEVPRSAAIDAKSLQDAVESFCSLWNRCFERPRVQALEIQIAMETFVQAARWCFAGDPIDGILVSA